MDILEVKNLTKKFDKFAAVDNISFSLKEGEILGLLGPNGAGKTTTIQMLLGVLTPTKGTIAYFGKELHENREEILEKINFSSTYTNLPWNLTVKENLTFISYLYDIKERSDRIQEVIDNFRLKEILDQPLRELSSGQITRINLAKAFINDPKVLLLDEPTASLDPEIAKFIRDFILKQRDEKKTSIVFTSHNMTEVEEVCDRILFINNGKIVADDTPDNLMKTIDETTVNLVIDKNNEKALLDYTKHKNWEIKYEDRQYSIHLKEKEIAELLTFLSSKNIPFHEISIDKPGLEDYFLKIARKNKFREA